MIIRLVKPLLNISDFLQLQTPFEQLVHDHVDVFHQFLRVGIQLVVWQIVVYDQTMVCLI